MNPKHTLKEYADALTRAGLLTASTLTPAAEGTVIDCLSYDTRSLHGTSLFLCKGAHFKAEYLSAAIAQGAAAYVAEKPYPVDAPQLLVSDIRYAMVVLGQLFYDHVTDKLTSVGITGTKGKTTTAFMMRSILEAAGHKSSMTGSRARASLHAPFSPPSTIMTASSPRSRTSRRPRCWSSISIFRTHTIPAFPIW